MHIPAPQTELSEVLGFDNGAVTVLLKYALLVLLLLQFNSCIDVMMTESVLCEPHTGSRGLSWLHSGSTSTAADDAAADVRQSRNDGNSTIDDGRAARHDGGTARHGTARHACPPSTDPTRPDRNAARFCAGRWRRCGYCESSQFYSSCPVTVGYICGNFVD